jgi:hypothetical protein
MRMYGATGSHITPLWTPDLITNNLTIAMNFELGYLGASIGR